MKKLISVLLILAMLAAMIPATLIGTSAEPAATTPTGNWTDEGNYDISWCKTLPAAKENETFELNGTHYHIMAWTKQIYRIDTAAKLAGLAYLSNKASGDLFKGDTFYIEADLDLSAHYWVPISKTSKFRGSLIGNVNGGSATITGMTIDTHGAKDGSIGLIGKFGGDWIKNIKLTNASINAHSFTVGSFVGWQDGNVGSGQSPAQGGYENLYADTKIVLASGQSDRWDDVGGIVGLISNCNANNLPTIIKGCVFTGTISAPKADNLGGIVGLSQYNDNNADVEKRKVYPAPVISDCVVISEKLECGQDFINENHNVGFGGIAGNIYSNNNTDTSTVTNCYVAAHMVYLNSTTNFNVGGIVGASCSQTKTYTNCQFDGIISGGAQQTGGILGRCMDNTTFTNCVVSGVALAKEQDRQRLGGTSGVPTVNNVYTAVKSVKNWNNDVAVPQITADTDLSALLNQTDADGKAIWTKEEGALYPILAVAKAYLTEENRHLSVAMSGADFSWFDPEKPTNTKLMTNEAQLAAAEILAISGGEALLTKQTIRIANVLIPTVNALGDETVKTALLAKTEGKLDEAQVANVYAQRSKTVEDGKYSVRFVAEINGLEWTEAGFELLASYTDANGVKKTSQLTKQEITVCYRSVLADDTTTTAPEGHYYILFVLNNIPTELGDMTFTVAANVKDADGNAYTNVGSFVLNGNSGTESN